MTKLRVHELAKELGMENKDLMEILEKKNVEVPFLSFPRDRSDL